VRIPLRTLSLCLTIGLTVAACGDDGGASSTANSLKDQATGAINQGAARVQAEALRALIKEKADNKSDQYTSMTVLEKAIDALPGDPTVVGLTDANGDGKDDDGKLEVQMNGEKACVSISGKDINVDNNSC
jgi:hypothetical protein